MVVMLQNMFRERGDVGCMALKCVILLFLFGCFADRLAVFRPLLHVPHLICTADDFLITAIKTVLLCLDTNMLLCFIRKGREVCSSQSYGGFQTFCVYL